MPKGRGAQHRRRNKRQKLAAIAGKVGSHHPFAVWWDAQRKRNISKKPGKSIDRWDRKNASKGHSVKRSVG